MACKLIGGQTFSYGTGKLFYYLVSFFKTVYIVVCFELIYIYNINTQYGIPEETQRVKCGAPVSRLNTVCRVRICGAV